MHSQISLEEIASACQKVRECAPFTNGDGMIHQSYHKDGTWVKFDIQTGEISFNYHLNFSKNGKFVLDATVRGQVILTPESLEPQISKSTSQFLEYLFFELLPKTLERQCPVKGFTYQARKDDPPNLTTFLVEYDGNLVASGRFDILMER